MILSLVPVQVVVEHAVRAAATRAMKAPNPVAAFAALQPRMDRLAAATKAFVDALQAVADFSPDQCGDTTNMTAGHSPDAGKMVDPPGIRAKGHSPDAGKMVDPAVDA